MISHVTLGTNNLDLAVEFYDQILGLIDAKQVAKTENVVFYELPGSAAKLAITKPHNGEEATFGNGTMLALKLESKELVEDIYRLAKALNSKCEGKPGTRDNGSYFGAYFRDLDGNKLAVFLQVCIECQRELNKLSVYGALLNLVQNVVAGLKLF